MKHNYMKMAFMAAFTCVASMAGAVDYPTYPTQTLTEGGKYVLCNLANPTGYTSRTSWDGAFYFLGETDSNYQDYALTAHQETETGRWYFVTSETEVPADEENGIEAYTAYTYLGVPSGTDNLNGNLSNEAFWVITPGVTDGFYYLTADDGQGNAAVIGKNLHLNSGGQYFVISEPGNYWYPDFYGGTQKDADGQDVVIWNEEEQVNYKVMADSTSMNWAFVAVEDVPAFVAIGTAWKPLADYEKNYCGIEGYETGFQASLAAAEAAFKSGDYDTMNAIMTAKVNLYTQLLKAIAEDASALTTAIATATEAFNTLTDADVVNAAYEALKKACDDYAMGLGDITSMGTNMSFEDLSAQGGNATSGIAAPPMGWNVFIKGNQVTTAAEVSAAGIANWHGVNTDCNGYKDGDYGFGIWTSAVPEYEISQTITGLDNGTYIVTAGLMVGANGNGSRRTTQRIFANLNSTMFASIESYAEGILPLEYKEYANLNEPVTDQEMQQVSVRAYVYDGTLTFGVRTNGDIAAALREGGNSAGGDGWFKTDYFTISKEGFIQADQDNLYNYLESSLYSLSDKPMDATYKEKYQDVSFDDKDQGIAALGALITEAQAQVEAYETLGDALTLTLDRLAECEEVGYAGIDDYYDIYDEINGKYENGEYTAEEIADAVAALEQAYQDCLHSGVDEGADVSDLIINRSFENLSNQGNANSNGVVAPPYGWNLYLNGVLCETVADINAQGVTGWCAINSGDGINVTDENGTVHTHQYTDGTHLWGIWNASIPQVELSQKLTGLNPGTYMLTADVMARNTDWSGDNLTTQRIFANDVICVYGTENDYIPEYLQNTTSDDIYQAYNLTYVEGKFLDDKEEYNYMNYGGWDANSNDILLRTLVLHFGVDESGEATIGFRTDNLDGWTGVAQTESAAGWFKVDNFTLYYESSTVPTKIEDAAASGAAKNAVYDLTGRRVKKAQKGVYIVNGKKVLK